MEALIISVLWRCDAHSDFTYPIACVPLNPKLELMSKGNTINILGVRGALL